MRIGVNARFLIKDKLEGFGWYSYEVVRRLVAIHPEHEFVLFFDRPYDPSFVFGPNVTPVVVRPAARHPLLFVLWFELLLPFYFRKYRIERFFSPDGYLSLSSSVPQFPVIHDINFEHYPTDIPLFPRWHYRFFFKRYARKAKSIITVSHFSKQDIQAHYGIAPEKIHVAWNGASEVYVPLDSLEKKTILERYEQALPYFLFVGSLHPRKNIQRLLEAFAAYKAQGGKRNLLIVGAPMWDKRLPTTAKLEKIKKYVRFLGHLPLSELHHIIGAAHALVYVPYFEGFGIPMVEAMKCGVPVVAGNRTSLPEVLGDAGLLVDPFSVEDIQAAMQLIDCDKALHQQLSEKALERSKVFSWDNTAKSVARIVLT